MKNYIRNKIDADNWLIGTQSRQNLKQRLFSYWTNGKLNKMNDNYAWKGFRAECGKLKEEMRTSRKINQRKKRNKYPIIIRKEMKM